MKISFLLVGLATTLSFASAFLTRSSSTGSSLTTTTTSAGRFSSQLAAILPTDETEPLASVPQQQHDPQNHPLTTLLTAATTTAATLLPTAAMAAGPDWGLFEGRTGSLIHPVVMGGLFLYSLYTAFLGFQWRRQRTLGDDITALKSTLPAAPVAAEGADAVEPAVAAAYAAQVAPIQSEIDALTQERKDLSAAKPRDQHFSQGALLAFLGTAIAIEGCLNTFGRAGKLFPGPHLYAGAGLVVLWGLAVATVPAMQKGNDTARTIHIGANVSTIGLFAWQVTTGIPILLKVWEKTSWP